MACSRWSTKVYKVGVNLVVGVVGMDSEYEVVGVDGVVAMVRAVGVVEHVGVVGGVGVVGVFEVNGMFEVV